jgi:glycolate oxidase FAD binding subunit
VTEVAGKMATMKPSTEAELAAILQGANAPLRVRGGGTRGLHEHQAPVIETAGLAGVTLYEPGALTLVVRAGTPLDTVAQILAAERQRLAFEVPDLRGLLGRTGHSTIGGVVAANASGPRRIQAGACRDSLIGIAMVTGAGEIIKNGGRVMKNVTGYDLVKLMAGSHGTLGVLTEVSFKLQALPEVEATLVVPVTDATAGVAVLARALGSPFDVSGAACDGRALIRVEGMAGSVAYRASRLQDMLGGDVLTADASARVWAGIRDVVPLHGVPGAIWRVSVKPTDGPTLLSQIGDVPHLLDWGGGLVWCALPDHVDTARHLRACVDALGGHATRMRGVAPVPVFHPEPAPVAALSRAVRTAFDPRGILNGAAT